MDDQKENIKIEQSKQAEQLTDTQDEQATTVPTELPKEKPRILAIWKNISIGLKTTFLRFTLAILILAALSAITIFRIETPYDKIHSISPILDRVMAVLALGVIFSLCVSLFIERYFKLNRYTRPIIYLIELGVLFIYYYYVLPEFNAVTTVRLLLFAFSLVLAFIFIPYLLKREPFEIYVSKLLIRVIISVFFAVVIALGITAILFTVEKLLFSGMNNKLYIYTWILAGYVFAPIHYLYGLPKQDDILDEADYNKVQRVLIAYIIMPLIAVYTLVLYIYFVKIIVTHEWPQGLVSYLVLIYAMVGIFAVFFTSPLCNQNKWVDKFSFYYIKLIFPLIAMMFVSIGMRISEFGITENRYFILIIGSWCSLAMLLLNFNKRRLNIILPISLAIVSVLTVIGPWSAFEVSVASQNRRFYSIAEKNNMIKDGKLYNERTDIKNEDKIELAAIVDYFERNHKNRLKYLPVGFDAYKFKTTLGIEHINNYDEQRMISYYIGRKGTLDIAGYSHLMYFGDSYQTGAMKTLVENSFITVKNNDTQIFKYNLVPYINKLYNKYGDSLKNIENAKPDFTVDYEDEKVAIRMIFETINFNRDKVSNDFKQNYIQGCLLLRFK